MDEIYMHGVRIGKEGKGLNFKLFTSKAERDAFFIENNNFNGYVLLKIKLPIAVFLDYLEPQSCLP